MAQESRPGSPQPKQQVWTENYKVASFLVNLRGQAGLYSILNFIQDVGWLHAIHLEVKLGKNLGWVFTRQKLTMTEWPAWNQGVTVKTWIRPPATPSFLMRDYEIFNGDRKIGECTSTFAVMDLVARKLANQDWDKESSLWRKEGHLPHEPKKITWSTDVEELAQYQVRNSDIDLNQHVNNTKYAQWVLDSIPIELLKAGADLQSYEVNFLAEAKSGDVIAVQKLKEEKPEGNGTLIQFQGVKLSNGKPIFTAQLKITRP